jgi:hypothetical protein
MELFGTSVILSSGMYNSPNSVVVADINCENQFDIAVVSEYAHSVGVFLGDSKDTFKAQIQFSTGTDGSTPQSLTVGDFNGDNRLDFAVTSFKPNNVAGRG